VEKEKKVRIRGTNPTAKQSDILLEFGLVPTDWLIGPIRIKSRGHEGRLVKDASKYEEWTLVNRTDGSKELLDVPLGGT
jgi:hypothetical protein